MSAACCTEGRGGVYICSVATTEALSGARLIISSQRWIDPVQFYCGCMRNVSVCRRYCNFTLHLPCLSSKNIVLQQLIVISRLLCQPAARAELGGQSPVQSQHPPPPSYTSKRIFVSECGALSALLSVSTQRTLRRSTSSSVKSLSWTTWPASCWFIRHVCCTSLK